MSIAKDGKRLIWILLAFGLPLLVYGSVRLMRPDPGPAQLAGPRPGAMVMSLAVGEALREIMLARPDREMLVVCGHTHDAADVQVLPNLRVLVGAAEYGNPVVQQVFEFD